jgi:type IV pilus assembly protein PilV
MRPVSVRGFTLLEVMIALVIFSLGLLGMAGLMVVSMRTNNSAYLRTQASFLAQSMSDRMRANTGKIDDYNGDYDSTTANETYTCSGPGGACGPDDLVARDAAIWSKQMIDSLPNPTAHIECTGTTLGTPATSGAATYDGLCNLTITWTEATLDRSNDAAATAATQTFAWVFQP